MSRVCFVDTLWATTPKRPFPKPFTESLLGYLHGPVDRVCARRIPENQEEVSDQRQRCVVSVVVVSGDKLGMKPGEPKSLRHLQGPGHAGHTGLPRARVERCGINISFQG